VRIVTEVVVMQDDTWTNIQCFEAVHGDESEAVRQLYTAVQSRGSEVSFTFNIVLFTDQ